MREQAKIRCKFVLRENSDKTRSKDKIQETKTEPLNDASFLKKLLKKSLHKFKKLT
uniref:Uncharacterized protein n=1 Tax=uncultured bacterium contig00004 TaxID=1181496 RepID=A0A806JXU0_9BACT|nr:hypothetical protein [uncultured bacterium contig00004]